MIMTFWKLKIICTFVCTLLIVINATFEQYGAQLGHIHNSKLQRYCFSWFISNTYGSLH